MSALISYECVCGHRFLIGVAVDGSLRRAGIAAASAIGAAYVDRSVDRFVCGGCGRTHDRLELDDRAPAAVVDLAQRR